MTYAYCRVSTLDQNEDRQLDAMAALNIQQDQIFTDKLSGKDFSRTAWLALIKKLKHGDLLYIHSIDRLGRNYADILDWWRVLTKEKGVDIVVLDMPLLDTRRGKDLMGTFLSDVVLALLSYVAQNEREMIRKRQAEGIAAAKSRGIKFGRPVKKPPDNFPKLIKAWEQGSLSFSQILEQSGLKESSFYRRLREFRANNKK